MLFDAIKLKNPALFRSLPLQALREAMLANWRYFRIFESEVMIFSPCKRAVAMGENEISFPNRRCG